MPSRLAPAVNRVRPTRASGTRNVRPFRRKRSRFLFILFHLFRLLVQLRRSHTNQQRELSPRLKSAFLKSPFCFSTRLWPANLSAYGVMVNRRALYPGFTADRVAIRDRGVAVAAHEKEKRPPTEAAFAFMPLGVFGIDTSIHQVPFLPAHPNGR